MEVVNKLGQLLNIDEDQHGIISKICEETGLARYTVRALLHNEGKSVRYDTLAKVCQYLIDHDLVNPAELPGALLGFAPNKFWPLLSERQRIEFCMGTRQDPQWLDELVMAADSELQAKLTHRITQAASRQSGTNKQASSRDRQIFLQRLISAPTRNGDNAAKTVIESKSVCDQFESQKNDRALVCLGSVKSNSVIERLMSQCFAETLGFQSQDGVETPHDRACPFTILFRSNDPQLNSCCGGKQLSRTVPGDGPGIYFEDENGNWSHVPWNTKTDGAIVYYRYHRSLRNLHMCLGGYSSRATRFLADFLHSGAADRELWPPVYEDGEIQIGLFVVQFNLESAAGDGQTASVRHQKSHSSQVFQVSREAIRRRIRPTSHQRSSTARQSLQTVKPR